MHSTHSQAYFTYFHHICVESPYIITFPANRIPLMFSLHFARAYEANTPSSLFVCANVVVVDWGITFQHLLDHTISFLSIHFTVDYINTRGE